MQARQNIDLQKFVNIDNNINDAMRNQINPPPVHRTYLSLPAALYLWQCSWQRWSIAYWSCQSHFCPSEAPKKHRILYVVIEHYHHKRTIGIFHCIPRDDDSEEPRRYSTHSWGEAHHHLYDAPTKDGKGKHHTRVLLSVMLPSSSSCWPYHCCLLRVALRSFLLRTPT